MAEEQRAWCKKEEKQATDEVTELAEHEEAARQQVPLAATLE
jgi:hypothetical protein